MKTCLKGLKKGLGLFQFIPMSWPRQTKRRKEGETNPVGFLASSPNFHQNPEDQMETLGSSWFKFRSSPRRRCRIRWRRIRHCEGPTLDPPHRPWDHRKPRWREPQNDKDPDLRDDGDSPLHSESTKSRRPLNPSCRPRPTGSTNPLRICKQEKKPETSCEILLLPKPKVRDSEH